MYINVGWVGLLVATLILFVGYYRYRSTALSQKTFSGISKLNAPIAFQCLASYVAAESDGCSVNPSWFLVLEAVPGVLTGWVWQRASNGKRFLAYLEKAETYRALVKFPDNTRVLVYALKDSGNMVFPVMFTKKMSRSFQFVETVENVLPFPDSRVS